ncbi:MAG: ion channel [Kistimonas sp.]|nr:ion channel [Kistimonas sp.]
MNPLVANLFRLNLHLTRLRWSLVATGLVCHFLASWALLGLCQEPHLTAPDHFYYFYLVTASTVGYGDLSPRTLAGQLLVSLFVIPGAIALFAAVVGKVTTLVVKAWSQNMKGKLDVSRHLDQHLVIMGWHESRTARMIDLVFGDKRGRQQQLVLVSSQSMDNPFPELILFVHTDNLASAETFRRAALDRARQIIVSTDSDDSTLTTALSLVAQHAKAHIVCHFENKEKAQLLRAHAPRVECCVNATTDMLVRSAQDPGSTRVQEQLISTLTGPTQFSLHIPANFSGCSFHQLLTYLKHHHDVLVLGTASSTYNNDMVLNPPGEHRVEAGQYLYFISHQRLHAAEIDWQKLQALAS